jgi:hypothetical protein
MLMGVTSWELGVLRVPLIMVPDNVTHKHTLAQGSFGRSSIVCPPVLSLFVRSSDRSIVRPIVHGSFVRSSDRSIVCPFVCPNNLCSTVMLPKFRSFARSIIRSFIVPIHRSSFVHSSYSSFVHSPYSSFIQIICVLPLCCRNSDRSFARSFDPSSVRSFLFIVVHSSWPFIVRRSFIQTIHHHYSPLLFIVYIHRHYSSSLLFIDAIYNYFFIVTIHCYYSSIIRSPQISTTHPSWCPVHLRPYSSHTNSGDCDFPSSRELPI